MAVHVDFSVSWLASAGLPPAHAGVLLRLLDAIGRSGSVKQAAQALKRTGRRATAAAKASPRTTRAELSAALEWVKRRGRT